MRLGVDGSFSREQFTLQLEVQTLSASNRVSGQSCPVKDGHWCFLLHSTRYLVVIFGLWSFRVR